MSLHRFVNGTAKPLLVWIEPWCEEIYVPPDSTLIIRQEGIAEGADETIIEPKDDMLVFWCGGSTYSAELDGAPLPT